MGCTPTIKTILYNTLHRNKKTIDQIADEIGRSTNAVYRYCLEGESGSEVPVSLLVPIMKATKNFSLLKHIAHLCGFVCVKIPRVSLNKKDEIDIIDNYQHATVTSIKLLKEFFSNPTQETFNKAKESLTDVMEECASNSKYIDKKLSGQLEMEL